MLHTIIDSKYMDNVFLPITLLITNIEAALTAGPAISNTNAVPGERPFSIRATAIGMEPVAHRYMGIAKTNTVSMLRNGLSANMVNRLSGTTMVISPAIINPITNHLPMSCIISTKA